MLTKVSVLVGLVLLVMACGGDDDGDGAVSNGGGAASSGVSEPTSGPSTSGDVVNRQDPGRAAASVDGVDFAFDAIGPVGCTVSDREITAGFILGDNEVSFVAGATPSGSGWRGRIDINVQGSEGITTYSADFSDGDDGAIAVDGSSMSYSGDWEVVRPGSAEAEPAGQGVLSATCG